MQIFQKIISIFRIWSRYFSDFESVALHFPFLSHAQSEMAALVVTRLARAPLPTAILTRLPASTATFSTSSRTSSAAGAAAGAAPARKYGGLKDEDRIFTNLYGLHDWGLKGALKRVSLMCVCVCVCVCVVCVCVCVCVFVCVFVCVWNGVSVAEKRKRNGQCFGCSVQQRAKKETESAQMQRRVEKDVRGNSKRKVQGWLLVKVAKQADRL